MTFPRLVRHLRVPLFRSGYALVANTAATSLLGAVYWVAAARLYGADEIGVASALIAAMTLLSSLAALNLNSALNRFLPAAGDRAARLVWSSYAITVPLSAIAAAVFLAGLEWWTPGLRIIRSSPPATLGFVAATMLWTIFVLQDAALAGLRKAGWILTENTVYGVVKILLLVGFAGAATALGLFASWTLPLLALVIPVNLALFRRAIPEHHRATFEAQTGWTSAAVSRFAATDYVATLLWRASVSLLPIVVLEVAGAAANAYFYLAWTIAYTLYLVSRSTGIALVTEGALEPGKLVAYARRVLAQTAGLVIPAVVVIVVGAPWLLRVFGPEYAAEGSTVLRLLVLSAIPHIVVSLYVSIARVEQSLRSIVVLNGAVGVAVVATTLALLPTLGLAGVGWAWLLTQTAAALILLATRLRSLWIPPAADLSVMKRLAAFFGPQRRLDRESAAARARLPEVIDRLEQLDGLDACRPWRIEESLPTELDLAVASLRCGGDDGPAAVVKLAATAGASAGVLAEAAVLQELRTLDGNSGWLHGVPALILTGDLDGLAFFVEEHLEGSDARRLARSPGAPQQLVTVAAEWIGAFHEATRRPVIVDEEFVDRLVDRPLRDLSDLLDTGNRTRRRQQLAAAGRRLRGDLLGKRTVECWIHGDFWFGNLLASPELEVVGVVDWAQSERRGLPALDVLHLVLTARALERGVSLGTVAVETIVDQSWTPWEERALAVALHDDAVPLSTLIMLTWLRHVASNVRKSYRYRRSLVWATENVDQVLGAVGG